MKISLKCVTSTCALLATACVQEPIEWEVPRALAGTIGANTRLAMDEDSNPALLASPAPLAAPAPVACHASVTTTRAGRGEWYAAWLRPRSDSSVVLEVARSTDDGATWGAPVVADDRDRGRRGCARPGPALTADSASGYVHAAYYIEPPQGAGVWYTHSLERGRFWHQPMGVLYGGEAVSASIASSGDTVLVAYEHPGSRGTRLGLAISRQAGHTFAERLRVRVNGSARDPRVALRQGRLALAWTERQPAADRGLTQTRVMPGRFR